jgi:hypothetical protein
MSSSKVFELYSVVMEDWSMMQKTAGDEGADWAERFEMNFYLFIDELKEWINQLDNRPKSVEEAEELPEIKQIIDNLPGPLYLNFSIELEEIIENIETNRYD